MAMTRYASGQANWWAWGGAAAAIVVIAALAYGLGWFGGGDTETVAPVAEQAAPATD